MEEIKADIWKKIMGKKLKPLLTSRVTVLTDGQPQYSRADDFEEDEGANAIELFWGDKAGLADTGSTTSITFPASVAYSTDIVGRRIVITSGTGQGGIAWITAYDSTTRVATLGPTLSVAPAAGSGYLIIDATKPLTQRSVERLTQDGLLQARGEPCFYASLEHEGARALLLAPVPYRNVTGLVYVIHERYFAHLLKLDLAGAPITRTYLEWRSVYEAGLKAKSFADDNDDRETAQFVIYQKELKILIGNAANDGGQSDLQVHVTDY
jgi:hypothetical protein